MKQLDEQTFPACGHPRGTFARRYVTEQQCQKHGPVGTLQDVVYADMISDGTDFVPLDSVKGKAEFEFANRSSRSSLLGAGALVVAVMLTLIGSAMPAYCQTAPVSDKITLTITRAELQVIGNGLAELPYKTAAQVMNDLQMQLTAADQAAAKAATEAAKPAEKTNQVVEGTPKGGEAAKPSEAPAEAK
jgi:hypothetical protein